MAVTARVCAIGAMLLAVLAGCSQLPTGVSDAEQLTNAIDIDNVGLIQEAVSAGRLSVNQRIRAPGYPEGAPLIAIAARSGSLRVLRYLIAAGADVNARTAPGETALMLASYFGSDDARRGAAANERQEQAARLLVEAGASVDNVPHHYTPLAYAAYQGHDRIVRYLIERGARVNGDAQDGVTYVNTPLMMAAIQGNLDTALLLLRAGADARVRVHQGNTAAEFAQRYNHVNLVGVLRCAETLQPGDRFAQRCAGR